MTTTQALLDSLLAHKAAINLASTEQKNQALEAMASQLESQSDLNFGGQCTGYGSSQKLFHFNCHARSAALE